MAITYSLIASNTLSSSAASVTFSAIPNTYTDLVVRASIRCANAGAIASMRIRLNGDTGTNYSETDLRGTVTATSSSRTSNKSQFELAYLNGDGATSNTFSSHEIYIPSYLVAQNKPVGSFHVTENNSSSASSAIISGIAGLYRSTSEITTILIDAFGTNLLTGSSFFLYGIKNS